MCRRRFWRYRGCFNGSDRSWDGPRVDTLAGSRYTNMKELRFRGAGGEWRVAFAFDMKRAAILLAAGNKSGVSQKRFYRGLIRKADRRFDAHVARLGKERK